MVTQTLVEQLEQAFEKPKTFKMPQTIRPREGTLVEYVSDELMQNGLPRISPELFELKRGEVEIQLNSEQKKAIENYFAKYIKTAHEVLLKESEIKMKCRGNIPRFFYANVPGSEAVEIDGIGRVIYTTKTEFDSNYANGGLAIIRVADEQRSRRGLLGIMIEDQVRNQFYLNVRLEGIAPFMLNVCATVPKIPEGFIELGDEAIAKYYDIIRTAPKELRRKTTLEIPKVGVLWSPKDESLYATGKIPEPSVIPPPPPPAR